MATGDNNGIGIRKYGLEFSELITAIFEKRSYFRDFFGGTIETLDGVSNGAKAFTIKTSDIPVVVNQYDTTATTAFGTGTGNSTRFGQRTEIIYVNTDVEYTWNWAIHEGIDRFTVNADLDAAIADRLDLQAQAKISEFNAHHGAFIATNAGKTITEDTTSIVNTFNELSEYFTNIEAIGRKIANVTPDIYNKIVDSNLSTLEKRSDIDIKENTVRMFKGFEIKETPAAQFAQGDCVYAYVFGVGKAFTGINTVRTIESEDFDGVALQGAGKAGEFIPNDNKKAVVKVKRPSVTISFDKNGGTGTQTAIDTGAGGVLTYPECTFTAPSNKEFAGWGDAKKQPGDKEIFLSNTTIKAQWKDAT